MERGRQIRDRNTDRQKETGKKWRGGRQIRDRDTDRQKETGKKWVAAGHQSYQAGRRTTKVTNHIFKRQWEREKMKEREILGAGKRREEETNSQ
jgi:hypothetical protein